MEKQQITQVDAARLMKGSGAINPKTGAPIDPGLGKKKMLEEESAGRFYRQI